ncbi:MAG: PGF-pre-PGF domain-containing protein [Nanoarchaeota archaeon]
MVSKKESLILFGFALVLTVLLSISFVASTVVLVNPLNNTLGQNISKTNIFFNVTAINSSLGIANPLNVTFYASPNGNGTWLLIGNHTAGCVPVVATAAYNMSCGILLNITNSQITDGNYTINATVSNATGNMSGTMGVNLTMSVTIDGTAPAVVANLTPRTGYNLSNATTGAYTINVSIIDALSNLGSVYFNITNASSTQVAYLTATNASAGAAYNNRYFNATWNVTAFNDGLYNITILANDTLGNMNSSVRLQIRLDSVNPNAVAANITSVGTGHNITGTYVFNFSVSDLNSSIGSVTLGIVNGTNSTNVSATFLADNRWSASVNTASYADGSYNITIVVNDTAGNQNSTNVLDLRFDNTAPSVSLSCTPNPVEQGDTITCTCSSSDAHSGIRSTGSASTTDTASSGPHTSTCSATNMANLTGSTTYDYTVSGGSTGSGSSGSGSGSSGTTTGASTGKVQRTFESISAGDSKTISGLDSSFGLKSLEITVNNKVQDVKVTINKFNDKPSGAVSKGGKVYKYLEISATNVDGKISSATITTLVSKKWVTDNQLSKDKVALFRLVNSAWVELPTTITEEGDNYVLASISPGFSFFSIAEKVTPAKDAEAVAKDTAPAGTPEVVKSSNSMKWIIGIVVLLVIVLVVFLVKKKVTSGKK